MQLYRKLPKLLLFINTKSHTPFYSVSGSVILKDHNAPKISKLQGGPHIMSAGRAVLIAVIYCSVCTTFVLYKLTVH